MSSELEIMIIDLIDLIEETLSSSFIEKWRFRYSERFIKHFQLKLLQAFNNSKPIKLDKLYKYLTGKCKYSPDQVISFFESIDIEIYQPVIYGKLA